MIGQIKMELLSDTCIGSGESVAGIVDTDVVYDEHGIPNIPSKRLIGILRGELEELNCLDDKNKLADFIKNFFGEKGSDKLGKLIIRNGEIDSNFKKNIIYELKKEKLNYQDVLSIFTKNRTQTAISCKGVAKENSLRIIRTLKKGNVFYFDIDVDCSPKEEKLLIDIIKCVRHIGSNRNRGLGNIKCSFIKHNEVLDIEKIPDNLLNKSKINYQIELLSDCVVDNNYITSSTFLGIAINSYVKKYNLSKEDSFYDDSFKKLFLNGEIIVTDAYPSVAGKCSIPTPKCFRFEKDKKSNAYNLFSSDNDDNNISYQRVEEEFGVLKDKCFMTMNVQRNSANHHRQDTDFSVGCSGKDGDFYNYNSIKSGSVFAGTIESNIENIKTLVELLHNKKICLGKSRKSEYGNARVSFFNCNVDDEFEYDGESTIPVILVSDLIVLNKFGQPSINKTDLESSIKNELGFSNIKIDDKRTFLDSTLFSRFNSKRKLPETMFYCFAKGSVLGVNIDKLSSTQKKEFINSISKTAVGEYTKFGFGILKPINISEVKFSIHDYPEDNINDFKIESYDEVLWLKEKIELNKLKEKIFTNNIGCPYFDKIIKYLLDDSDKSKTKFLTRYLINGMRELKNKLLLQVDKEKRKTTTNKSKSYKDLFELLNLDDKDLLFNETCNLYRYTTKENFEEYYVYILKLICQKISHDKRGYNSLLEKYLNLCNNL